MLTTFSSSHTLSNTEAAILSRRNRNRRNKSGVSVVLIKEEEKEEKHDAP